MENWWLKIMDKKKKRQVNWIEQVELYRIRFTNVVIFNNKSFKLFNFDCCNFSSTTYRSNHWRWSVAKGVLRNFARFTGKHLCSLRPATLLKKRPWHRCFSVNFAKFQRKPFVTEHLRWLLLNILFLSLFEKTAWKLKDA